MAEASTKVENETKITSTFDALRKPPQQLLPNVIDATISCGTFHHACNSSSQREMKYGRDASRCAFLSTIPLKHFGCRTQGQGTSAKGLRAVRLGVTGPGESPWCGNPLCSAGQPSGYGNCLLELKSGKTQKNKVKIERATCMTLSFRRTHVAAATQQQLQLSTQPSDGALGPKKDGREYDLLEQAITATGGARYIISYPKIW
jgi:hypothetical protein